SRPVAPALRVLQARNIVGRKRLVTRPPVPEIRSKLLQRPSLRRRLRFLGFRAYERGARNQNRQCQKTATHADREISQQRAHTSSRASSYVRKTNRHEHPLKAIILADRGTHLVPLSVALEKPRRRNHRVIVQRPPHELHPERQFILAQAARHADRRQSA